MREGCGGRRSRYCLVAILRRDKYNEGSTKHLETMITMNNKATRITEAIAKPEAARPERSGTATERGARPNKNKK
jgi:hypothetical protein